jgi:N-acetylmuramic acid 6-phosphate (MurNAc-6-P) etherase
MARITEASNSITACIDEATIRDSIALLQRVDGQIFDGFDGCLRLADDQVCKQLDDIVSIATEHLRSSPKSTVAVIMSGAGTSGRLAFLTYRSFKRLFHDTSNALLARVAFEYLNAGGDAGLIEAQEHAEDNVEKARQDLRAALAQIRLVDQGSLGVVAN